MIFKIGDRVTIKSNIKEFTKVIRDYGEHYTAIIIDISESDIDAALYGVRFNNEIVRDNMPPYYFYDFEMIHDTRYYRDLKIDKLFG